MAYISMMMTSFWDVWYGGVKQALLAVMAICALFIILVVMFQPGNSSGVSALGGTTETFLGKNKSKTFEHKMKLYTVISGIVFTILAITFAIIAFFS
ncbi:MAG: preprotein translocase subunit SecG [Clostridia bacterium]|nr:preprotein translocase subunit SecG [Clostridia bacterium]